MLYTRKGTERIIRYAFETARTRPRKHLTLIDKANAVRAQDLYTRVFAEVAKEYPDIETAPPVRGRRLHAHGGESGGRSTPR